MSDVKVYIARLDLGTVELYEQKPMKFTSGDGSSWTWGADGYIGSITDFDLPVEPGECRRYRLVPVDNEEES
jgi:hypothetical protein